MTDLQLVLTQARYQLTSIMRSRRAVIFTFAFPVIFLLMFNSIFTNASDAVDLAGKTVTAHAYFTGGMLAYAIMLQGFTQLAIVLVTQRETGQLKRYRGTPVPAWTFICATLLRVMVLVGLMAVVLLTIARVVYGVEVSGAGLAKTALYVVLGTATLCSVGIAATTIATDLDTATAALPFAAVLVSFISGIFIPVDQLPNWLADIGRFLPVYHLAIGLQAALGVSGRVSFDASDAAVLCAWAVGGIVFASRRFRWEPQAASA